jgi:hypothetical protein
MWLINEYFEDIGSFRNKSSLHLNADKPIDPYHISYPILWTGFLNNEKIVIKQLGESSSRFTDYEFIEYPENFSYLQVRVVKYIDDYLRILD